MNGLRAKDDLIEKLFEVVKMTRAGADIQAMYRDGEYVMNEYEGDIKKICIAADSGIEVLRDVLAHI